MQFLVFILFIFSSLGLSSSETNWTCEKANWKEDPKVEEGLFSAVIQTRCTVSDKREDGISWLFQKLQKEYLRKEKYDIHEGPTVFEQKGFSGIRYDLTDKLSDDESELAIRQKVTLLTDLRSELGYKTTSTEIKASGLAAYLQYVAFETEVKAMKDFYQIKIENEVRVERPWYALGFLFKPMSASITEEKFLTARDRLIEYLLTHDDKTSPSE